MNTVLISLRLKQEVSSAWLFTWLSVSRCVGLCFGFSPGIQSTTRKRVRSRLGLLCKASCGFAFAGLRLRMKSGRKMEDQLLL